MEGDTLAHRVLVWQWELDTDGDLDTRGEEDTLELPEEVRDPDTEWVPVASPEREGVRVEDRVSLIEAVVVCTEVAVAGDDRVGLTEGVEEGVAEGVLGALGVTLALGHRDTVSVALLKADREGVEVVRPVAVFGEREGGLEAVGVLEEVPERDPGGTPPPPPVLPVTVRVGVVVEEGLTLCEDTREGLAWAVPEPMIGEVEAVRVRGTERVMLDGEGREEAE